MVRAYSAALGFETGAHALGIRTAATSALGHKADIIAKVQEWPGYLNGVSMDIHDGNQAAAINSNSKYHLYPVWQRVKK